MPFIITTVPPRPQYGFAGYPRIAVATLEEAKRAADRIVGVNPVRALGQINDLPADGGTIGPLPDGTVIEVRPVSAAELARLAGCTPHAFDPDGVEPLLDAFNAK